MFESRFKWAAVAVVLIALFAAPGCGSSPTTPTPAGPVGTWSGTAGNATGTSTVTLVLTTAANGYQGSIRDNAGRIAANTPVLNVTWDGTTLTFVFQMADGTGVNVSVRIQGDNMTGTYVDSQGEHGSVQCVRQR